MKYVTIILIITVIAICLSAAKVFAEPFKFNINDVGLLIENLKELDGYDRAVDQGPGNPSRVVREPFKFSRETRAKLGADRAALIKSLETLQEKLKAIRLKISGDPDKIDEKDTAQMRLWKKETKILEELEVDLSPVTADELTVNDNPIPISVLSVLAKLRPGTAAAVASAAPPK